MRNKSLRINYELAKQLRQMMLEQTDSERMCVEIASDLSHLTTASCVDGQMIL